MQIPQTIENIDSRIKELLMICYKECRSNFPKFQTACTTAKVELDLIKYWKSIPQRLLKKNSSFEGKVKHFRKRFTNSPKSANIHMSNIGRKMIRNFIQNNFSEEHIAQAISRFLNLYSSDDIKDFIQSIAPTKANSKESPKKKKDKTSTSYNETKKERTKFPQKPFIMPVSDKLKSSIVPWNAILFKNGSVWIYNYRLNGEVILKNKEHLVIPCKESRESFNDIKKYFIERLPDIRAYINNNDLVRLVSELDLQDAIKILQDANDFEDWEDNKNPFVSTSKVQLIKDIDYDKLLRNLKKKKSSYLDYLVSRQAKQKKVVPCNESLCYDNNSYEEDAFIFSLCTDDAKTCILVLENVNVARSTIAFIVKEKCYDRALRTIHDFIKSDETNKRQRLHYKRYNFKESGIIDYICVNHTTLSEWSYKMSKLL